MRATNTAQTYQNSKTGSPSKLPQPHQGQKKYKPDINLNSGAMTERTKPVQNFQLSDYEKHQTLPYLWYSGSIEEEEFLNIAYD